ncbi:hypothetical protein C8R44DRAFT_868483 [Mycena epipterygia]|nr:hypothetical protein C8R44DRAFT_868483 [Mycena epipterygia]
MPSSPAWLYILEHPKEFMLGVAIPGIILVPLLLSSFAYLACREVSRPYLDRVSFRLLVLALIANLLFSILVAIRALHLACVPAAFLTLFSTLFSACMFFCMALNLQLVLLHGVNGKMMEKYYIIGSTLLCLACSITPCAAGQLGWKDPAGNCWLRKPTSPSIGLPWTFGTQELWTLLMSTGELAAFIMLLCFMLRQELRFRKLKGEIGTISTGADPPVFIQAPIVKYRSTILRIGLYPVLSFFWSITDSVTTVYLMTHGGEITQAVALASFLALLVYGLRPVLYVLLAATDPGVLRAIRALHPSPPEGSSKSRLASMKSMESMDPTSPSHTKHKYPRRFSETNKAVVRVELSRKLANTWEARSMEVRDVQFVYPQDREISISSESVIWIVEDDSIVGQF